MPTQTPKTTYLQDYAPPAYRIPTVDLRFELGEDHTLVHSRLHVIRARSTPAAASSEAEAPRAVKEAGRTRACDIAH